MSVFNSQSRSARSASIPTKRPFMSSTTAAAIRFFIAFETAFGAHPRCRAYALRPMTAIDTPEHPIEHPVIDTPATTGH